MIKTVNVEDFKKEDLSATGINCVILRGIPASGKSTFAIEFVDKNAGFMRLNKDSLRQMLFNSNWDAKKEKIVRDLEYTMFIDLIESHVNIIIDDTNVATKTINKYLEFIEIHNKYNSINPTHILIINFPINLEKAIRRDARRREGLGEEAMRGFYMNNLEVLTENGLIK